MKGKTIFLLLLLALFIGPLVSAQTTNNYDNDPDVIKIKETIQRVIDLISIIGGAIATLSATVVGVMMMQTSDPAEKQQLKEKLKYIIIGLVIIVIAPQIVGFII